MTSLPIDHVALGVNDKSGQRVSMHPLPPHIPKRDYWRDSPALSAGVDSGNCTEPHESKRRGCIERGRPSTINSVAGTSNFLSFLSFIGDTMRNNILPTLSVVLACSLAPAQDTK